jgi:hypothetical protein
MKWLVTVDSSEEELKDISYVELSHDDNVELSDKQCLMLRKRFVQLGIMQEGDLINIAAYKPLHSSQYRVKPIPEVYS